MFQHQKSVFQCRYLRFLTRSCFLVLTLQWSEEGPQYRVCSVPRSAAALKQGGKHCVSATGIIESLNYPHKQQLPAVLWSLG